MFYSFNGSNRRGERTIELFSGGKIIKIFSPLIVICLTRSVKDWIKKLILSFPDLIVSIQRSLIREKIEWLFSYLAGRWVCDYKIGSAPHNWNISTLSRRLQLSCLRMSRSQGADNLFCTEKLRINNSVSTSIQSQTISYMLSYTIVIWFVKAWQLVCLSLSLISQWWHSIIKVKPLTDIDLVSGVRGSGWFCILNESDGIPW